MNAPEYSHMRPARKPASAAAGPAPGNRSPCTRHLRLLAEFSHALQSAGTLAEAIERFDEHLPRLFHTAGGALYLLGTRSPPLRRACAWGRAPLPPASSGGALQALCASGEHGGTRRGSVWLPIHVDGHVAGLLALACPAAEADALLRSAYTAATIEQIALEIGNMKSRDALREQSIRDPLTGLYNRRYLEESLQRELLRAVRMTRRRAGLAVLMIDVDHFKRFNDEHGHEAGDIVLGAIGSRLRRVVRASDIASRFGGEEFVVVLPEVTPARAMVRAEQVRAAVEALCLDHHGEALPPVTVSVGVAMYPQHGDSVEILLRAADHALYGAKRDGRNQIRCVTAEELHDTGSRLAGIAYDPAS
jgi:diguanylate cyclase (GGDEF)-like protein